MHSAASSMSYWLQIVLDLTPRQLCEAKKVDYAVAYARTVAGVHYEDDNIAGLNMGQYIVSQEFPGFLNATYPGSDMDWVLSKGESSRFDWRDYKPLEKCNSLPEITRFRQGTLANEDEEFKVCNITFNEFTFLHDNGIVGKSKHPLFIIIIQDHDFKILNSQNNEPSIVLYLDWLLQSILKRSAHHTNG